MFSAGAGGNMNDVTQFQTQLTVEYNRSIHDEADAVNAALSKSKLEQLKEKFNRQFRAIVTILFH